jgi:acyl CoA:acetate/3-ketoacid CoA transferase
VVNLGIGLPEGVAQVGSSPALGSSVCAQVAKEEGISHAITLTTEAGTYLCCSFRGTHRPRQALLEARQPVVLISERH